MVYSMENVRKVGYISPAISPIDEMRRDVESVHCDVQLSRLEASSIPEVLHRERPRFGGEDIADVSLSETVDPDTITRIHLAFHECAACVPDCPHLDHVGC